MYNEMLAKQMVKWQPRQSRRLTEEHFNAAMILMEIELEEVRGELEKLYSQDKRGRKGYDPVCMLRALLLMMILQYERITKFVDEMKDKPRLAIIAGFEPKKTPAISTFYLFIDRLEDGEHQKSCEHRLKPSKKRKKKHIRNLSAEKENKEARKKQIEKESDSVTIHLKKELLAKKTEPRVKGLQKLLEDLLMKLAIIPSANKGLLGELNKLKVCGDGSALETGANCNGQPTCDCRSKGIYKCKCDRIYSDPTANWGFDSYRQIYYFGHTFYQHITSVSGHDLPLHITMGPAS
ncbi:MAG: transposase, partial [Blastocatellia bacterium]